jgi:PAS domain S-box-containing protein
MSLPDGTKDGFRVVTILGVASLVGWALFAVLAVVLCRQAAAARSTAAALGEQLRLTRTITDNATAALFMEDRDGGCIFMNPAAEAMFGFSFAELRHRKLHEIIHHTRPDGRPFPMRECPIFHALQGRNHIRGYEDVFFRKGGERFPVLCAASAIYREGRQVATVLEVRDVTEQKQIEEEREHLLTSERAARGEAERAARVKDEFIATLSHELRTPLNAIVGWTGILLRKAVDPDAAQALRIIDRNAHAQAQMVEDLLDMNRILAGKLHLRVQPTDLGALVKSAAASLEPAARAKQIRLETVLARAGTVQGDPGRLQQVVWNLLSNALKFTPKGGCVRALVRRMEASVEIVVADTGQGLRADFVPHVFERFRQADSSTTRRHGGLGLGLSLVRHIVELHGGTVRAESEGEGRGATFTASLPLVPGEEVEAENLRGIKVLVVDDEEEARELVRRLLSEREAEVIAAESAAEALAKVEQLRPDVLLSDIGMPDQDGYYLIRAVRTLGSEHGGKTPAAALTAFARPEDRARALRAGYQMHLAKPVDPGELVAVVASLAASAEARAPA